MPSSRADRYSRYCQVRHCEEKHGRRIIDGFKHYSRFCPEHTCKAKAPFIDGQFCPNATGFDEDFCAAHQEMTCSHRGCNELSHAPADVRHRACEFHKCAMVRCYKPKAIGQALCEPHVLYMERERQASAAAARAAAAQQSAQRECRVPDCHSVRVRDSLWCVDHTCNVSRCHNETHDDDLVRCFDHMPCNHSGCDHFAAKTRDGENVKRFCSAHLRCSYGSCTDDRVTGLYCKRHTCVIDGCHHGSNRDQDIQFCDKHTCRVVTCRQAVHNSDDRRSLVCYNHKCQVSNCLKPGTGVGPHSCCEAHACAVANCGERRQEGLRWCASHACQDKECEFAASLPGGYCAEGAGLGAGHACIEPGCLDRRAGDRNYPRLCRAHLNERILHLGQERARRELAPELDRVRRERDAERERARRAESRAEVERARREEREEREREEHEANERAQRARRAVEEQDRLRRVREERAQREAAEARRRDDERWRAQEDRYYTRAGF